MKRWLTVDFDLTVTTSQKNFPYIGPENPYAIATLKTVKQNGHGLILYTMREKEEVLDPALEWLCERGIIFDAVNDNPIEETIYWNNTPRKITGIIVDDHCLGIPLVPNIDTMESYVDWKSVAIILRRQNWIGPEDMEYILDNRLTAIN